MGEITTVAVAPSAWEFVAPSPSQLYGGRPFVIAPGNVARVSVDGISGDLPCVARWQSPTGHELQRFELPATGRAADSLTEGCSSETLRISSTPRSQSALDGLVELRFQLPRLSRSAGTENQSPITPLGSESRLERSFSWHDGSEVVERLVDGHVDLVNQLFDELPATSPPTARWQGQAGSVCVRSIGDTTAQWEQVGQTDQPRMALIVRLAEELPDILAQVCRNPRAVLRRERQFQNLGRVREIDSGCLRWLARQPGTTVAEKAGSRQQALAIVRVESIDTLENRVVHDLIIRAVQACRRYLREHKAAAAHSRVRSVDKFRLLLEQLLKSSPINGAARLTAVPQPNYVLQMEPRYHILWVAYQRLVQQQRLEDNVWRWRQRLFAEHFQLGVIAGLHKLADPMRTHGGDVLFRREQNAGYFLDSRTALGPWRLRGGQDCCVDLVRNDQLRKHSMIPMSIAEIGPDFVLVKRSSHAPTRLVAFWSVLDFDLGPMTYEDRSLSLLEALKNNTASPLDRFLLLQPMPASTTQVTGCAVDEFEQFRSLRMTIPLQPNLPHLIEQLSWALESP